METGINKIELETTLTFIDFDLMAIDRERK